MTQSSTPSPQSLNFTPETVGTFGGNDDGVISASTDALLKSWDLTNSNDVSGGGFDFYENTTGSLTFGLVPKFTVGGGATTIDYSLALPDFVSVTDETIAAASSGPTATTITTNQSITTGFDTAGWSQTSASLSSTGFDPAQDSVSLGLVFDANNLSADAGETNDYPFIPNVDIGTPTVSLDYDDELISISPSSLPKGSVGLTAEIPGTDGAVTANATLPDGAAVDDNVAADDSISTLTGSNVTDDNALGVNIDLVAALRAWATDKAKEGDVAAADLAAELNVIDGELGSSGFNVHWALGTVIVSGGVKLGEQVSFTPTKETVTYVTPYQTVTGALGQNIQLNNPAGVGSYNVNATYTITGTLTSVLQAVFNVGIDLQMLTAGVTIAGFSWDSAPLVSVPFEVDATPIDIASKSQTITLTYTTSYTVNYDDPNPTFRVAATPVKGEYFGHPGETIVLATTDPGNSVALTNATSSETWNDNTTTGIDSLITPTGTIDYDTHTGVISYTFSATTTDDDLETLDFQIVNPKFTRKLDDEIINVLDLPIAEPTFTPYSPLTPNVNTQYTEYPAEQDGNLVAGYFTLVGKDDKIVTDYEYDTYSVTLTDDSLFGLKGGETISTRTGSYENAAGTGIVNAGLYVEYTPGQFAGQKGFTKGANAATYVPHWSGTDTLTLTLNDLTTGVSYTGIKDSVQVVYDIPYVSDSNNDIVGPNASAILGTIEPTYSQAPNAYKIQLTADPLFGVSGASALSINANGQVSYKAGVYSVANASATDLTNGYIVNKISYTITNTLTGVSNTGNLYAYLDLKAPTASELYNGIDRNTGRDDVFLIPGGGTVAALNVAAANGTDALSISIVDDYLFTTKSGSTTTTTSSLYIKGGVAYFKAGAMPSAKNSDDTTDAVKYKLTDTVTGMSTTGTYVVNITPGEVPVANVASVEAYEYSVKDTYKFSVADTATNLVADLSALNSDSFVSSVEVDENVGHQANLAQAATLVTSGKVGAFMVTDSVANFETASSTLLQNKLIAAITLTGAATVAQAAGIAGDKAISAFTIADTSADVGAALTGESLNAFSTLTSISLTDATPKAKASWTLTGAEYGADAATLAKVAPLTVTAATGATPAKTTTAYSLTVTAATVAEAAALQADANVTGFAISDTAANVEAALSNLNADTKLTAITLSDGSALTIGYGTYVDDALTLGKIGSKSIVVNGAAAANAATLQAAKSVESFSISDTAANIAKYAKALNSDTKLTGTTRTTGAVAADAAGLQSTTVITSFAVSDTASHVAANLDALNGDTKLTGITLSDTSVLTLTVAQALNDSSALRKITNANYTIDIVDSASNVVSNLAALNADAAVVEISASGAVTAAVAEQLQTLKAAANIAVSDTAANIQGALGALNAAVVTKIAFSDTSTPTLNLTYSEFGNTALIAALKAGGATKIAYKVSGASVANAAAVNSSSPVSSFTVSDAAAHVAQGLGALATDGKLKAITLTDAGTPTLTLTVAQATQMGSTLALIANASYAIAISDSVANVAGGFDALNGLATLTSIKLTGTGTPVLTLTAAQTVNDTKALAALGSAKYGIAISDTATNIAANAVALAADGKISLIAPTSAATAQQAVTLQGLGKLVRFTVQDTAASIAANANGLAGDTKIAEITATGAATALQAAALQTLAKLASFTVQDTAANIATNAKALAKYIALSSITATGAATASQAAALQGLVKLASFAVQDTTANVTANLAMLASATKLTSLTLSDAATLTLAYSTYSADSALVQRLAAQTGFFVVTGAAATKAAALQKFAGVKSFTVADSAANVAANLAPLSGDTKLTAIALTGADVQTLTVTVANALTYATWLAAVGIAKIAVSDTAANVAANLGKLAADSQIASIALSGAGVQTLTVSVNNALTYATWLAAIGNAKIVVSDSSANVAANLAALAADSAVKSITLTGSGAQTLTVSAANAATYATWLAAIVNARIVVSDTAANVVANLDKLAANSAVKAITLTDAGTPTLVLSVAQATGDTKALAEISNAYAITISDTASAVAAGASALNANGKVTGISVTTAASVAQASTLQGVKALASFKVQDSASAIVANLAALSGDATIGTIGFTDSSAPTLTLSIAQATQGAKALGKLTGAYTLKITDTAANVYADATALAAMSGSPVINLTTAATASEATTLQGLSGLAAFTISDSAADVASAFDSLNLDSKIGSIAITGAGAPKLTLSVAQALNDSGTLAKISNANYQIAISDSAADIAAQATALMQASHVASIAVTTSATASEAAALQGLTPITSFNVADSGDDILAALDQLAGDAKIGHIAFTDAGTVTLPLTPAQEAQDAAAIQKFTGSNYKIVTQTSNTATAAQVYDEALTLEQNPNSGVITLTTPATVAEAATLQGLTQITSFNVADSAADVSDDFLSLNGDTKIGAITLTDSGTLTLTAAEAADDGLTLGKITPQDYQIDIVDSAADVVAEMNNLETLANHNRIAAVTLTDAGIPVLDLPLNVTNNDVGVIDAITNTNFTLAIQDYAGAIYDDLMEYNGALFTPGLSNPSAIGSVSLETAATVAQAATLDEFDLISSFDVADSAANVSADIDALNADTKIASITLTDFPTPMLKLTVKEALDDSLALGKIAGDDYLIDIVDTDDAIQAHSAALSANSHIAEINGVAVATWSGTGPATAIEALEALSTSGVAAPIDIADTAQNIGNYLSSLQYFAAQGQPFNIDLTDSGTPTLTLSLAQYNDQSLLGDITNSSVYLTIDDTAANLYDDLVAANGGPGFSPAPYQFDLIGVNCIGPATAQEAATLQDSGWINPFAVADTAAEVSDHFDALNNDAKVTSITLTDHDTPTLYLTVAQALNGTTALGEISNTNYQIFIVDTAADVAGAIDALSGDAKIASIALTDPGTPALNITPVQAQNDAATLHKITTAYTLFSLPPGLG